MTERTALFYAGLAHLALLLALSLSWTWMHRDSAPVAPVPVEFVDIADVPAITERPKESMEAAPRETVEEAAPQSVPDAVTPLPDQPGDLPEPVKTPPAKKVAPKRLDMQELTDMLDKSKPVAKRKPMNTSEFAKSIERAIPKGVRIDARAAASLEQAIRSQIQPCWNPPLGAEDAGKISVVLRIRMRSDGSVVALPDIVSQTGVTAANAAYARSFVESTRRAVLRCSPLQLPADMYEIWRDVELNFDPSQLN